MKGAKFWVVAGFLGLLAVTASAEWQRTVTAWDTRLPAQGKLQLMMWGNYWTGSEDDWDWANTTCMFYVNYGIRNNWSASIAPGIAHWSVDGGDSKTGISDTDLQTEFRILEEAQAGLDLAVVGRMWLPTGDEDKGLGSGSLEPGLALAASKTFGPVIGVANAGGRLIMNADEGEKSMVMFGMVEGIFALCEQISVNGSFDVTSARYDGTDATVDIGAGARMVPIPQVFLSGALYLCLTDAYDWGLQLVAGYEF